MARRTGLHAALVTAVIAWPVPAHAQDPYDACSLIADDAARLTCFDETHARQKASRVSEAAAADTRRDAEFGFTAAQIGRREDEAAAGETNEDAAVAASGAAEDRTFGDEEESEDIVRSTVTEVFADGARRPVILLANGQVWRATSNRNFHRDIRSGWEAEIRRSWTGGYRMKFAGQSGYLGVARIR